MTDPSPISFPSPVIAQEYLAHATPETVYAWLKANAGELGPLFSSPLPDELLKALVARNDPIINLGVASVATDPDILRDLWRSGDQAIRNAIAGNPYRDQGILGIFRRHSWADEAELTAALQDGNPDFIKLWCTNPALEFRSLKEAFSREGVYEKLSDERWIAVIYWGLQNPNLTVRDDRHHEGTDFPAYRAGWDLLLTLPNTRTNAYVLCERYSKLNTFAASYETLLDEKLADIFTEREKWQHQHKDGEILFLRRAFERWTAAASPDSNARDKEGKEAYEFQTLRQDVAAAVANHGKEITSFIKGHDDVHVRRGYYRAGRFVNAVEVQAGFVKDGKDFLEAAIYNENLYATYPNGVRAAFQMLVADNPRYEDYPVPSFTRIWNHQATQFFKRDPARYPDPNAFESRDDDDPDVPKPVEERTDILSRLDRIEAVVAGCGMILIAAVSFLMAWGAQKFATSLVEAHFPGLGDVAGGIAFIVALLLVWHWANVVLFKKRLR